MVIFWLKSVVSNTMVSDSLYLVTKQGEKRFDVQGKVGFPFFGQLILDCVNRTENAMTQAHCFKAAELGVLAQLKAVKVK